MFRIIIVFILLFTLSACDGGLNPNDKVVEKVRAVINGTVVYIGGRESWLSSDSVKDVRVVAFKNYPPKDILTELLSGNAYFTANSLPFFTDSSGFSLDIPDAPIELKYLAVALQYDDTLTHWLSIGVYTESGDNTNPSSLDVKPGKEYFIKINVDFKNLPPQPFE